MSGAFAANLARRVATAVVVLPALVAVLFLAPPAAFASVAAAAVLLGMRELHRLIEAARWRPFRMGGYVLVAALFAEAATPRAAFPAYWPAALLLLLVLALRRPPAEAVPGAAATLLGAAYLGAFGGAIVALRLVEPVALGAWRVVLLLGAVMSADSLAYFVGHAVGRRPLSPALSPAKTVEGGIGGLLGGAAGALVVRALGLPELPLSHAAALGVAAAAAGTAGDLFESQFKRWAGVKDSGSLFPGHGGMLDRLDSLLFAAPVLYYYFVGRS
jgi:phosphatidate cytidylyltransferase